MKVELERCKGNYGSVFDRHARPALVQTTALLGQTAASDVKPAKLQSVEIQSFMEWKREKKGKTLKNYDVVDYNFALGIVLSSTSNEKSRREEEIRLGGYHNNYVKRA